MQKQNAASFASPESTETLHGQAGHEPTRCALIGVEGRWLKSSGGLARRLRNDRDVRAATTAGSVAKAGAVPFRWRDSSCISRLPGESKLCRSEKREYMVPASPPSRPQVTVHRRSHQSARERCAFLGLLLLSFQANFAAFLFNGAPQLLTSLTRYLRQFPRTSLDLPNSVSSLFVACTTGPGTCAGWELGGSIDASKRQLAAGEKQLEEIFAEFHEAIRRWKLTL